MKIQFTFKDPDTVYDTLRECAEGEVNQIDGLSDGEREELVDGRHNKLKEACKPWIKWGEYVRIEIDTDAKTATVIPVR